MDFQVFDHGSIWLIKPLTESAADWLADNLDPECQMFGNAYAIEPRYVDAIIQGLLDDGLTGNVGVAA